MTKHVELCPLKEWTTNSSVLYKIQKGNNDTGICATMKWMMKRKKDTKQHRYLRMEELETRLNTSLLMDSGDLQS